MRIIDIASPMGKRYFLTLAETNATIRYAIYGKDNLQSARFGGEEKRLSLSDLKKTSNWNEFVVGSVIKSKVTGEIMTAGDIDIISLFIETVNKLQFRDSVITEVNGEKIETLEEEGIYIQRNYGFLNMVTYLLIMYKNYRMEQVDDISKNPTGKLKGLIYTKLDTFKSQSTEFRGQLALVKTPTLKQLSENYDLSWYMDSLGNLLKDYKLVETVEQLLEVKKELEEASYCILDVETDGLNFYDIVENDKGKIVGVVLSWKENQAVYVCIDMVYTENIPMLTFLDIMWDFLKDIPTVCHNALFDDRTFYSFKGTSDKGIKYENLHLNIAGDTMLQAFHIDPDKLKPKGLKPLTKRIFKHNTLSLSEVLGKGNEDLFRYCPRELILLYACPDGDYTRKLFKLQSKILKGKRAVTYKMDILGIRHLVESSYYGSLVDTNLLETYEEFYNDDILKLEELIYSYVGQRIMYLRARELLVDKYGENESIIEDKLKELQRTVEFKEATRKFNISGNDLKQIMFDVLRYPVFAVSQKTGEPSTGSKELVSLMRETLDESDTWLKEDILSSGVAAGIDLPKKDRILVSKEKFNNCKYPLAILIEKHREKIKVKTSFFTMLKDTPSGVKVFADWSMIRAETARIIHAIQTLKGDLKKLIIAPKDWYNITFDFSQIEYRFMYGEAGETVLVDNLNDSEKDAHIEAAAVMFKKPAYLVNPGERTKAKAAGFGNVYGISDRALGEDLNITTAEAGLIKRQIFNAMPKLEAMVESFASVAIEKGYIINKWDRMKFFNIDRELTEAQKSGIGRAAKNYPIQSGAREIFFMAFIKFRQRLEKEGIAHLVRTPGLLHDQLDSVIHKSVNPYYIMKIIYEECMLQIKNHPRYYCGVNVCDNWYEGKISKYEVPVNFIVDRTKDLKEDDKLVTDWKDKDWKNIVYEDKQVYMEGRIRDYTINTVESLGFNKESPINIAKVTENFTNYFIRSSMGDYYTAHRDFVKMSEDDGKDYFLAHLETILMEVWETDSIQIEDANGVVKIVNRENSEFKAIESEFCDEDLFKGDTFLDDFKENIMKEELSFVVDIDEYRYRVEDEGEDKVKPMMRSGFYFCREANTYTFGINELSIDEVKELMQILVKYSDSSGLPVAFNRMKKTVVSSLVIKLTPELEDEIHDKYKVGYYDMRIGNVGDDKYVAGI